MTFPIAELVTSELHFFLISRSSTKLFSLLSCNFSIIQACKIVYHLPSWISDKKQLFFTVEILRSIHLPSKVLILLPYRPWSAHSESGALSSRVITRFRISHRCRCIFSSVDRGWNGMKWWIPTRQNRQIYRCKDSDEHEL